VQRASAQPACGDVIRIELRPLRSSAGRSSDVTHQDSWPRCGPLSVAWPGLWSPTHAPPTHWTVRRQYTERCRYSLRSPLTLRTVVKFATQLNVLSQLFRTAGKSSRKTHSYFFSHKLRNNEAESPRKDADSIRVSTSLPPTSVDAVVTVPVATAWLRLPAGVSSRRCFRPTPSRQSNLWREDYDFEPLSPRRVSSTCRCRRFAAARYATLSVKLLLLTKLFLLLITLYLDNILSFSYTSHCRVKLYSVSHYIYFTYYNTSLLSL